MIQRTSGYSLFPVIMPVAFHIRQLKGRERAQSLRRLARRAVQYSAFLSNYPLLSDFKKDKQGKPLSINGLFWSLSHKTEYVSGVVSKRRTGIDIEKIRPCSGALCAKIAGQDEWQLWRSMKLRCDPVAFSRYWTAKEAVLKVEGVGLKGLGKCRIEKIVDRHHLIARYLERQWTVEQYFIDNHVVSVVVDTKDVVNWKVADKHDQFYTK
jgi:4'-phosphopantetheinyl transferase